MSTAPAATAQPVTLTRRTTTHELVPGKASGVTRLFKPSVFAEPRDSDAFAVVSWDAAAGKASAVVATGDACEAFDGESLSAVLLEAFGWAEQEAGR